MPARSAPPHPGAVLLRKFLIPRQILQGDFADAIGMHEANLSTFISGRRALTQWMAWAFARVLRTKPQYWMQLQGEYELWLARPRRVGRKRSPKTRRR
jgi:antitoxin HigA-1